MQVSPAAGAAALSVPQVRAAVDAAVADPAVTAALRSGTVEKVQVRAVSGTASTVVFLFRSPVEPAAAPWPVLCDIAGQTKQWRGVAALVTTGAPPAVEGSPVWLSGSNCVGAEITE